MERLIHKKPNVWVEKPFKPTKNRGSAKSLNDVLANDPLTKYQQYANVLKDISETYDRIKASAPAAPPPSKISSVRESANPVKLHKSTLPPPKKPVGVVKARRIPKGAPQTPLKSKLELQKGSRIPDSPTAQKIDELKALVRHAVKRKGEPLPTLTPSKISPRRSRSRGPPEKWSTLEDARRQMPKMRRI